MWDSRILHLYHKSREKDKILKEINLEYTKIKRGNLSKLEWYTKIGLIKEMIADRYIRGPVCPEDDEIEVYLLAKGAEFISSGGYVWEYYRKWWKEYNKFIIPPIFTVIGYLIGKFT